MNEMDKFNDSRYNMKKDDFGILDPNLYNSVAYNFYEHHVEYIARYAGENYDANKSKYKKHL